MQKILASLIAAVVMTAGLVAFSGGTATAAPYTGTVETSTRIDAPNTVQRNRRATIGVRVTSDANRAPQGRVTITVTRAQGGYRFIDNKAYTGSRINFTTTKLRKLGKYIVRVKFDRKPGSVFQDSDNTDAFKVVRR